MIFLFLLKITYLTTEQNKTFNSLWISFMTISQNANGTLKHFLEHSINNAQRFLYTTWNYMFLTMEIKENIIAEMRNKPGVRKSH